MPDKSLFQDDGSSPDVKKQFAITGVETVGSSPAEFAGKIEPDMEKLGKLIRDTSIRSQ